jgi:hypothetical protein
MMAWKRNQKRSAINVSPLPLKFNILDCVTIVGSDAAPLQGPEIQIILGTPMATDGYQLVPMK